MVWISKVFAPLALFAIVAGAAALVTTDAGAQPPFGKGQPPFGRVPGKGDDKKGEEKKIERKVEEKRGEERKGPGSKSDPVVDAWVKVLLDKITDPHDTVRDSARGALVNVGPPALPALQALADGNDSAKAVAARKVIGAIQSGPRPQGSAAQGQPGQPGRPGFGMGGMGPGGPPGMGRGPGGFPGMNPFDRGRDNRDRGRGPDRGPKRDGGRDGGEAAPPPHAVNR